MNPGLRGTLFSYVGAFPTGLRGQGIGDRSWGRVRGRHHVTRHQVT